MSGLSDKITGKAKQATGSITGDKRLENEGKADEAKGSLKEKVEQAIDTVTKTVDETKKKLDK